SQNLHPNNSPDLFKSDTGDDRLPQNPVGGGVGKYDKVELINSVYWHALIIWSCPKKIAIYRR
ncbi:hypothetical protein, partial [Thiolapillus sp.]|uniref:hypothetical protein n=1 Tax=Thiolapillus sp. TaxID=2017437 RepID=UPI003AF55D5C